MSYISATTTQHAGNNAVIVWERTPEGRFLKTYKQPYYFYEKDNDGQYTSIYDEKLKRIDFDNAAEFRQACYAKKNANIDLYESDIPGELKVLSEEYYDAPAPDLHVTFWDIEVDYSTDIGFASVNNPYAPINSIALYHSWKKEYVIIAVPPETWDGDEDSLRKECNDVQELPNDASIEFILCKNEKELLLVFLDAIEDSDVISGWNSSFFDTPYTGRRLEKLGKRYFRKLSFPEGKLPRYREVEVMGTLHNTLDLSGRICSDYLVLFKKYEMAMRPSYKLESIADEILPDLPKLEYEGSLAGLYRKNFANFVRYNLRDTEILKGFEERLGYVELANQMYHLSTGLYKHVTGTLKLAELATINYCHNELGGLIVNDNNIPETDGQIQGAFVLLPQTGMHKNISSVDIASLYPSAIRAINISPETIIGQIRATNYEELTQEEIGKVLDDKSVSVDIATRWKKSKEVYAADLIANNSDDEIIFRTEDGNEIRGPASKFRKVFKHQKWAVSGYGTVFNQNKQGIIPTILADWYAQRKKYKKEMAIAKDAGDKLKSVYYDKLQYVYKIKLNSFYGALTNKYFRFYDLRMGESTTGTGRKILIHQCAKACEILQGTYQIPERIEFETHSVGGDRILRWHYGYNDKYPVVYGDSVAGDSEIETPNGTLKIQDLFTTISHTTGSKEYSDCNTKALTYIKDSGVNEYRDIKYVVRHKVNKKMFRVWFGNTRYLDVTEDHSLIGYANSKHKTPGLVEVKPTDIGTNNINSLILNSHLPHDENTSEYQLSPEFLQLIGLIIGDGHVERKKESGVGLSVGAQDKNEIITKVINPLIAQGWFTSIIHMKNGHDIRLCGVKGWKFLREHVYNENGKKQFPSWIFKSTTYCIANLLKGYFSADGFANKNKTVGLCSTNLEFIKTVNRLLKIVGIPSNYWTESTENSFNGKFSGTYTKRLTVYSASEFGKHIGFIQDRKHKNIPTSLTKNTKYRLNQKGFGLITPTKIEEIQHNDYVYDIEVDDTHMFYANDLLVHNTDSSYFLTNATDSDEATKIGDVVSDKINESFQEYMQRTFLCNPGFDDIISCEREVVSDRGIFVDKKRYILHLVDLDGWKCDKLKVMGLDTKKTTMPKEVSAKLNGFVERLLKDDDWNTIASDIVEYKDQLTNSEKVMDIGLPKGVNKVEFYTNALKQDPSARCPGHVSASILYNICLKKYNDTESMVIRSGTKIKVFYITEKVGKFKSIAIPVDIERVPQWFYDNFEVDKKAHILRLVDKPLNNILKAIQKETPTRQSLLTEDLLSF